MEHGDGNQSNSDTMYVEVVQKIILITHNTNKKASSAGGFFYLLKKLLIGQLPWS
jgi:hypothetical protein